MNSVLLTSIRHTRKFYILPTSARPKSRKDWTKSGMISSFPFERKITSSDTSVEWTFPSSVCFQGRAQIFRKLQELKWHSLPQPEQPLSPDQPAPKLLEWSSCFSGDGAYRVCAIWSSWWANPFRTRSRRKLRVSPGRYKNFIIHHSHAIWASRMQARR